MRNPETMSKEEKRRYIFEDPTFENRTRFGWITDCLLGDIRTFLDGIENKDKSARDGGGNLSVPILINTALEFVAELYAGKTDNISCFSIDMNENDELKTEWEDFEIDILHRLKRIIKFDEFDISEKKIKAISKSMSMIEIGDYKIKKEGTEINVYKKYNATNNAIKFIKKYFPGEYQNIPNILWSGTRNGLVHTFYPTFFKYQDDNYIIRFEFYVVDRDTPSYVTLKNNAGTSQTSGYVSVVSFNVSSGERIDNNSSSETPYNIVIRINVCNLYEVLKKAIEEYQADLEVTDDLQGNFINAWESIEQNRRPINPNDSKEREARNLLSKLKKSKNCLLLQ